MFEWDAQPEHSRKQITKIAKDAKLERTIEGSMLFALSKCKGFVSQFVRETQDSAFAYCEKKEAKPQYIVYPRLLKSLPCGYLTHHAV